MLEFLHIFFRSLSHLPKPLPSCVTKGYIFFPAQSNCSKKVNTAIAQEVRPGNEHSFFAHQKFCHICHFISCAMQCPDWLEMVIPAPLSLITFPTSSKSTAVPYKSTFSIVSTDACEGDTPAALISIATSPYVCPAFIKFIIDVFSDKSIISYELHSGQSVKMKVCRKHIDDINECIKSLDKKISDLIKPYHKFIKLAATIQNIYLHSGSFLTTLSQCAQIYNFFSTYF